MKNEKEVLSTNHSIKVESPMKNIKVLGIDLAKKVFQLHGADETGKKVFSKRLSRFKLIEFASNLKPCTIAIEACGAAHYWARLFQAMGHEVRMMAPQFVKPYVQANKNDANDAAGIAEAATRPKMKFVGIKTVEQQDMLLVHRSRQLAVKHRTAQVNQIRGLLAEYGIIFPQGMSAMKKLPALLGESEGELSALARRHFHRLYERYLSYEEEVASYDAQIEEMAKEEPRCQELMKIEGIGPLTATAALASIGDPTVFKNGRQVGAWLGLVPKQHSSGSKTRLGGISKRGDRYLRTLLIQGARAVVRSCHKKTDKRSLWVTSKKEQKSYNVAAVALANKNSRMIWAILVTGECYSPSIAA